MVIPNALPLGLAERLREQFLKANYTGRDQARKMLVNLGEDLPEPKEIYTAKFGRCIPLESEVEWVKPYLSEHLGDSMSIRAHRMTTGDHFRAHVDDKLASTGFTLTLSKGWKWDWGGLLVVIEDGKAVPYLPRFNELVVIKGLPHFVTEVSPWAREARLTLVGFV